jgi:hypothetical protein
VSGHDHSLTISLNRTVTLATAHCLTGCAVGEVLGLAIGTALGLSNTLTIVLAILLAFLFGYSFTVLSLLRSGLALAVVLPLALASDTFSITVMEIVDNLLIVAIPGAMDAGLDDPLFWGSLALALAIAFIAAWPVNRYLIARGRGHAVVHGLHSHGDHRSHEAGEQAPPQLHVARLAAIGCAAITLTVGIGILGAMLAA